MLSRPSNPSVTGQKPGFTGAQPVFRQAEAAGFTRLYQKDTRTMVTHGKGPKWVLVKRYPRWVRGARSYVESHFRGYTPPLFFRESPLQLDFGF